MTQVFYSVARGRPPGARKKLGHTVTWAAWWKGEPGQQSRPDAYGGARSGDDVARLVREHAERFIAGTPLKLERTPSKLCQIWRKVWAAEMFHHYQPPPPAHPGFDGFPSYEEELEMLRRRCRAHDPDFASEPYVASVRPPKPEPYTDPALAALGLEAGASEADVRHAFRVRARDLHPDRGGDERAFKELNGHYQRALKVLRGEMSTARFVYPGAYR